MNTPYRQKFGERLLTRRHRYESVHAKLESGEIDNINDLITYNLNIRQFAQDGD